MRENIYQILHIPFTLYFCSIYLPIKTKKPPIIGGFFVETLEHLLELESQCDHFRDLSTGDII